MEKFLHDEVLSYLGKPLPREHLHCYSTKSRIWDVINVARFQARDSMTDEVYFRHIWTATISQLLPVLHLVSAQVVAMEYSS